MKAKIFWREQDGNEHYCIDKKMHIAIGYGYWAGPCDGSCEPKEVELGVSDPRLDRVIHCFLETGKSSWSETEPEDEASPEESVPSDAD